MKLKTPIAPTSAADYGRSYRNRAAARRVRLQSAFNPVPRATWRAIRKARGSVHS